MVFNPLELVVGHLAFHDSGLAAVPSDGQEPFEKVLLERHQGGDQEDRGKLPGARMARIRPRNRLRLSRPVSSTSPG
jgi:hypothetical protein